MKIIIELSWSVLLAFTFASSLKAQQPLPCGNNRIDTTAGNKAKRYQLSNINSVTTVNSLVRVYFHICANDDGTNAAITTAQLATEFTTLLAAYAPDNICFLNAGTDTVKNTFLNTLFNADNDPNGTFFGSYQVPAVINCFYTKTINGNNTACNPPCGYGGIALGGIPGTFYLVASSNIGKGSTVAHEMGHCIGLLHTFEPSNGNEELTGLMEVPLPTRLPIHQLIRMYSVGRDVIRCLLTNVYIQEPAPIIMAPPITVRIIQI